MKKINLLLLTLIILTMSVTMLFACADKEEVLYKVTFDYDFESRVDSVYVKEGEIVKLPKIPNRDGLHVDYWTLKGDKFDISKPINKDIRLKAVWISDGLSFEKIEDKNEMRLTACTSNGTNFIIPDEVDGVPITEIGKSALSNKNIKSIVFPKHLKTLGRGAFSQVVADHIVIPASVENVESLAFANSSIAKLEFEQNSKLRNIGKNAFCMISNLKAFAVPDGVTRLDMETFATCTELEKVYIPNSVTYLENYIFKYCTSLKTIYRQRKVDGVYYTEGYFWEYKFEPNSMGTDLFAKTIYVDDISEFLK